MPRGCSDLGSAHLCYRSPLSQRLSSQILMLCSQLHSFRLCVHTPWVSLLQTPVLLPPVLDLLCRGKAGLMGQTSCPMAVSLSEMVADCIFLSQESKNSQGAMSCQMLKLLHTAPQRHRISCRCYSTVLPKDRQ